MADPEIIMVKAIFSALATCMLYTGHEYPRGKRSRYPIYLPLYSHVRYVRDRPSLSRYRGMASRASLPQKRTSGSDIRYTFHYTATCATCVIARLYRAIVARRLGHLYHRNTRVVPISDIHSTIQPRALRA